MYRKWNCDCDNCMGGGSVKIRESYLSLPENKQI
jgi:hypothetical protein